MTPRYLLAAGAGVECRPELLPLMSMRTGLAQSFCNRLIAAFVNPSCPCTPVGQAGCVLGDLFPRHGPQRQVDVLASDEAASIAQSGGHSLLTTYWGGYVAAIAGSDRLRILRDPSASFPCYFSAAPDLVLFASDADLLVKAGAARASIDHEEVGRQLYRAFVPTPATALANIGELLAGFALTLPGSCDRQEPCWSPWDHVDPARGDSADLAERLRCTVAHCVGAWAAGRGRILLSVSGGFDSSAVAACLAQARAETVCLTMFTDDPAGDERPFARALCDHLRLPLIERAYSLEDIDITEPLGAHLPRPRDRTQANAYERVHNLVASEVSAGAFMTGNGGDHVFGYSQSAAPIADRFLTEGLGHGVLAALGDVCRQTGCSMTDALKQAWNLTRRSGAYAVRPNSLFLARDFLASLDLADIHHPWLDAPAGALPGKAAHIATILRVQPNLEPGAATAPPLLNPLVSQPIVEACLAIPSWEWRTGGRDRSIARSAFASLLPLPILQRRIKGTPGRFAARLLDRFRSAIRERLLGGKLAAHRIVDVEALKQMLAGDRPVPDLERVRILELVSAEAWIDSWRTRSNSDGSGSSGCQSGLL